MDIRQAYDILDVPLQATAAQIREQYRDLVAVWHPDRYGGNARLRQKAENKLAEINAAYDAVLAFLAERAMVSPEDLHRGRPEPSFEQRQWASAKPKSLLRRMFVPLLLVSALASSVWIITRLDSLVSTLEHPARILDRTVQDYLQRKPDPDATAQTAPAAATKPARENPGGPGALRFIEIHLKNGTVIVTRSYRVDGDMLVYQAPGGSLGIQKSAVKTVKFRSFDEE